MRGIAEFTEAAGGRIAFEGVHGPPDAAHQFEVAGTLFQLQRLLVQRLQHFLRGLEEELPQFSPAFFGELGHPATSTCW